MEAEIDAEVGSTWNWTSEYYPIITDVPITVIQRLDNGGVKVEIEDKELIESEVYQAKKTYRKNGNDMDNVKEVHRLIKVENGEIVGREEIMFLPYRNFTEVCEKR